MGSEIDTAGESASELALGDTDDDEELVVKPKSMKGKRKGGAGTSPAASPKASPKSVPVATPKSLKTSPRQAPTTAPAAARDETAMPPPAKKFKRNRPKV